MDTCLAYIVYKNDACRGELKKEESTYDLRKHPEVSSK